MIEREGPYLIAGLGNPGRNYRTDRHNIGFMLLDHLATHFSTSFGKVDFNALITEIRLEGEKVILAKPQTFMNLSGKPVQALLSYFRIPYPQTLIVFDDLDLPLGSLRIRPQGGSGGHRGMESVIEHVGTDQIPRMRLGIGRPPGRMDPSSFVLGSFSDDELPDVDTVIEKANSAVLVLLREGIESAMSQFNFRAEE